MATQTTVLPGPLPVSITRGIDVEFALAVPAEVREQLRPDLIEPTELLLQNASVSWIERPALGWLQSSSNAAADTQNYRLREQLSAAPDAFLLIVTRAYSAERVTNLEGGIAGIPLPAHPSHPAGELAGYDCAALPLGEGAAVQLFDGVFFDKLDVEFGTLGTRADLPRRLCPEVPGLDLPPGNGTLPPAEVPPTQ